MSDALGNYFSSADAPFTQRSLPPSALDTPQNDPQIPHNYRVYIVRKNLTVLGGPISPWFGQPGLGTQFYSGEDRNISTLVRDGYLERVNKRSIQVGPGNNTIRCGF